MRVFGLISTILAGIIFAAFPASTNYKLQNWSVNSGGTNSAASAHYNAQATTGETAGSATSSSNYSGQSGSIQVEQASVPPAPSVDNGSGTYYTKLHFVVNNSANPSDATFAIQVDTHSNFSSPSYIQADGTLGASILYQNYSSWGSGSGSYAVNLTPNTTYYFRVSASEGKFTASGFGPSASVATVNPSLTFSVCVSGGGCPSSLALGILSAGSITSGTMNITYTTNAANGGYIYVLGSSTGLHSAARNYTINIPGSTQDLSATSQGFGLQGSTSSPLATQSPYAVSGTTVGAISTSFAQLFSASGPVSSSPATTATVKVVISANTPPATDYAETLTFVATASY